MLNLFDISNMFLADIEAKTCQMV